MSDQWLEIKKKSVKASTITNYQGHLDQIFKHIGDISIDKLTAGTINRMFLSMFNKGNSHKTVFERSKLIKNIIKFALEYDYLDEDLITNKIKIEKINVSEKDDNNYLEKDEATYVFEKMIDDGYEELADFFNLQIQTGMRFGELSSIHLPDINFNDRTINIKYNYDRVNKIFTLPKNNRPRLIHISEITVALIKKILRRRKLLLMAYGIRDNNLLFFNKNGDPLNLAVCTKILHEFESEEKPLTSHIFRHTFITRMMEKTSLPT